MPRRLTSQQDLEEAQNRVLQLRSELASIDEELTLYHPDGPWRFLEERLRRLEAAAVDALAACPLEEVDAHRAKLRVVRHLLALPEELREARARLQEVLDEPEPV